MKTWLNGALQIWPVVVSIVGLIASGVMMAQSLQYLTVEVMRMRSTIEALGPRIVGIESLAGEAARDRVRMNARLDMIEGRVLELERRSRL